MVCKSQGKFEPTGFAIVDRLIDIGCEAFPVGSQVTNDPPPGDASDYDWLVYAHDDADGMTGKNERLAHAVSILTNADFYWEGDTQDYQDAALHGFQSWRPRGLTEGDQETEREVNVILTASLEFARKYRRATDLCRRLNLPDRDDRLAVFAAIRDGKIFYPTTGSGRLDDEAIF